MSEIDTGGRVVPYPAAAAARYRGAGAWGNLPIAAEFRAVASRVPGREAVVAADGRLTFGELDEQADRLALGLTELGLRPGQRVILQIGNRLLSVVAWYGLLKAGLIPVCTLTAHRGHEIGAISRKTGAVAHLVEAGTGNFDLAAFAREQRAGHPTLRCVLTLGAPAAGRPAAGPGPDEARVEDLIGQADATVARKAVDAIQARIDPDQVAVFQLSGGTTGVPKVIPRLHAEYWYNARAYAAASGWDETTRNGHLIPVIHNAGIVCGVHAPHSVGGCLLLTSPDLDQALPLLAAERVTDVLFGHGHYSAITHPFFPPLVPSLRRVVLSGAKVPLPLFEALERHGLWTGQLFGMGEGFFALSRLTASREARLSTVGTPVSPLDEFRVLDPASERELPDGEVGELACRGPYTLRGYYDAPEINRAAFTSDGFYRTGDLVAAVDFDGERSISVEGRLKDIINRGGEKISAEEVEVLLLRHPGILAAALVAMPDERLGERSCAYLVAAGPELGMAEIHAHLSGLGVAKFKWPERLEWTADLPKTAVGKLDKKLLQREIAAKLRAERDALGERRAGLNRSRRPRGWRPRPVVSCLLVESDVQHEVPDVQVQFRTAGPVDDERQKDDREDRDHHPEEEHDNPGMAYPATVLALAMSASYPPPPDSFRFAGYQAEVLGPRLAGDADRPALPRTRWVESPLVELKATRGEPDDDGECGPGTGAARSRA